MNTTPIRILGASAAVAVLAFGMLIVTGCGSVTEPAAGGPTTTGTTTTSASPAAHTGTPRSMTTTTRLAPAAKTLGPLGYGALTLGMTAEQALATGLIVPDMEGTGPGCTGYDLADRPTPPDNWSVVISPNYGLVTINDKTGIPTPEGIAVGSTFAQTKAAYPDITAYTNEHRAAVPGNTTAIYTFSFGPDHRLNHLALEDPRQDCYR